MMNIEDTISHHRPIAYMSDVHGRKNAEYLLSSQRPVPLSRITKLEGVTSVKKQLQYYAHNHEPEQTRIVKTRLKHPQVLNAQTLDVTGQKVVTSEKAMRSYKSNPNLVIENV